MDLPSLSIPLIISAGIIDGINPCAFAVLIFMTSYLTKVIKIKSRIALTGFIYILSVYLTYFFIGLGLLTVASIPELTRIIYITAAVIAIVTGIINVKDYFYYGKGFSLKIPESQKKRINKLINKASIPASLLLGIIVSTVELPCTGSVYLVILALLGSTETYVSAINYLLLYNLMFVLPLIIMLIIILKGYGSKKAMKWKEKNKDYMKLSIGILLIGLGVWMLASIL